MIHPHTQLKLINETIGFGVVATKLIPKGTITWVLDDLDQKLDEYYVNSLDQLRKEQVIKYTYRDRNGKYILSWDLERFINHSFDYNCITTAYDFEIAIRDIYLGEEITDHYGSLNVDEPFECLRESNRKIAKAMPDDLLNYYQEWDQQIAEAMRYFNQVEQPLKHLINKNYIDKVVAVAEGKEIMDSVILCYFDRSQQ